MVIDAMCRLPGQVVDSWQVVHVDPERRPNAAVHCGTCTRHSQQFSPLAVFQTNFYNPLVALIVGSCAKY